MEVIKNYIYIVFIIILVFVSIFYYNSFRTGKVLLDKAEKENTILNFSKEYTGNRYRIGDTTLIKIQNYIYPISTILKNDFSKIHSEFIRNKVLLVLNSNLCLECYKKEISFFKNPVSGRKVILFENVPKNQFDVLYEQIDYPHTYFIATTNSYTNLSNFPLLLVINKEGVVVKSILIHKDEFVRNQNNIIFLLNNY